MCANTQTRVQLFIPFHLIHDKFHTTIPRRLCVNERRERNKANSELLSLSALAFVHLFVATLQPRDAQFAIAKRLESKRSRLQTDLVESRQIDVKIRNSPDYSHVVSLYL